MDPQNLNRIVMSFQQ
jgi:SAM-dependent methyltransferase